MSLTSVAPLPGELRTVRHVAEWFDWMSSQGGVPHPDDSAFQTCGEIRRLGFEHDGDHPDGHVSIVGPLFDGASVELARSYDRAMDEALRTLARARIDPYSLAMASNDVATMRAALVVATRPRNGGLRVSDLRLAAATVGERRDYAVLTWDGDDSPPRPATSVEWDDDHRALLIRTG